MPFSFRSGTAFSVTAPTEAAAASEPDLTPQSSVESSVEACFEEADEGSTWRKGQLSPAGHAPLRRNTRHLLGFP